MNKRKRDHKNNCIYELARSYNIPLYQFIRANGNWDNWDMIILQHTPCKNKFELFEIERNDYEQQTKPLLNIQKPLRTKKEYKTDNSEYLQIKNKEYYEKNKLDISNKRNTDEFKTKRNEYLRTKVKCENCGFMSNRCNLIRHKKSKKCMEFNQSA